MKKNNKKTEDINDEAPMTMERAQNLMVEFSETIFWKALLLLINQQDAQAVAVLATIDTFKEPTQAARAQGQRIAYSYIREIIKKSQEIARKREENERVIEDDGEPASYGQY